MLNNSGMILRTGRIIATISILISWDIHAQHFIENVFDQHLTAKNTPSDSIYLITTNYITTGICLRIQPEDSFEGSYIVVNSDTFYFHADPEDKNTGPGVYSNLYTSSLPVDTFYFYPGSIKHPVSLLFINAQMKQEEDQYLPKKKSADCSEPELIDQSEWRAGLPEPDYERISNLVHNIIIHHSAGSNSDTNYIQVVRNIYIYHTEIRGWSDIGYNYLIAQDGTIFKGRDPDTLEQDNVLGAHFCNKNTGTMGICVLGNYMETGPPKDAFLSLIDLITWKLGKDSLDPLGEYPHPLNPDLNVIAGHRDGCATDCPGDSLYMTLTTLRQLVMEKFIECGYEIKPVEEVIILSEDFRIIVSENEITIFGSNLYQAKILLTDLSGRIRFMTVNKNMPDKIIIPGDGLRGGLYVISILKGNMFYTHKIMLWE
jgi:hypothetical protein